LSPAPDGPTSPLVPRWGRHFFKEEYESHKTIATISLDTGDVDNNHQLLQR